MIMISLALIFVLTACLYKVLRRAAKAEALVTEMKEELEKAREEVKKLDQLKSDFISTVSHELRTPLSIMKEGVSQVLEEMHGGLNERQRHFLSIAVNGISRITRIVEDLLHISRIELGKVNVKCEVFDIAALASEASEIFIIPADKHGLEIRNRLPGEEVKVCADRDIIEVIFTNLINNALRFTEKGWIEVSVIDKKDFVECSVSDTGIGIPEEDLPRAFTKFEQFGRKAGPGEKGVGLGLAICKGIVELHKGNIWIESKLGQGTKITFTLPKHQAQDEVAAKGGV